MMKKTSPSWTSNDTSWSTALSPNDFLTWRKEIIRPDSGCAARREIGDDAAMASPRSIEVKVGVLILTALGLLAAFILVMGGINFQPTYSIFVDFDNPGGLQTGAPVKIAGRQGRQDRATSASGGGVDRRRASASALVRLKVQIEKRYQTSVHENSLFYVTNQSVLGEQFLAIEPGSTDRPGARARARSCAASTRRASTCSSPRCTSCSTAPSPSLRDNRAEIGEAFDGLRKTLKGTGEFMEQNKGPPRPDRRERREDHRRRRRPGHGRQAGSSWRTRRSTASSATPSSVSGAAARDLPPDPRRRQGGDRQRAAHRRRRSATRRSRPRSGRRSTTSSVVASRAKGMTERRGGDPRARQARQGHRRRGGDGRAALRRSAGAGPRPQAQPVEVLLAGVTTCALERRLGPRPRPHRPTRAPRPRPLTSAPAPITLPVHRHARRHARARVYVGGEPLAREPAGVGREVSGDRADVVPRARDRRSVVTASPRRSAGR